MTDKINPENLSPPCRFKSCEDWIPDIIYTGASIQCAGCKRFYPDHYRKRKGTEYVFKCPECGKEFNIENNQLTQFCDFCGVTWNLKSFKREE